jgi:hypothetical protein
MADANFVVRSGRRRIGLRKLSSGLAQTLFVKRAAQLVRKIGTTS